METVGAREDCVKTVVSVAIEVILSFDFEGRAGRAVGSFDDAVKTEGGELEISGIGTDFELRLGGGEITCRSV